MNANKTNKKTGNVGHTPENAVPSRNATSGQGSNLRGNAARPQPSRTGIGMSLRRFIGNNTKNLTDRSVHGPDNVTNRPPAVPSRQNRPTVLPSFAKARTRGNEVGSPNQNRKLPPVPGNSQKASTVASESRYPKHLPEMPVVPVTTIASQNPQPAQEKEREGAVQPKAYTQDFTLPDGFPETYRQYYEKKKSPESQSRPTTSPKQVTSGVDRNELRERISENRLHQEIADMLSFSNIPGEEKKAYIAMAKKVEKSASPEFQEKLKEWNIMAIEGKQEVIHKAAMERIERNEREATAMKSARRDAIIEKIICLSNPFESPKVWTAAAMVCGGALLTYYLTLYYTLMLAGTLCLGLTIAACGYGYTKGINITNW